VFVEEHLRELRRQRFSPPAVLAYVRRVAQRGRENVVANPGAVRSIWTVALGFFALSFVAAAALALHDDRSLAYDFFGATSLAILPVFALVTLYVDLLRDRDGYRLSALNLPTVLTLLRVIMLPGIVLFLSRHRLDLALGALLVAAFSDVVDGWLARRWKQITQLGTVLDPIVDIVFNLALFLGLAHARLLPDWVARVAVVRYGTLIAGGTWIHLFVGPVRIRPTFFGRLTGVVMTALLGFLVTLHALDGRMAERLVPLTERALGALMCATVLHVLALGWYNLRLLSGKASETGQVVDDVRWGGR
jgi:cardiolipin synthase